MSDYCRVAADMLQKLVAGITASPIVVGEQRTLRFSKLLRERTLGAACFAADHLEGTQWVQTMTSFLAFVETRSRAHARSWSSVITLPLQPPQ
jgi:hypothetical protein